MGMDTKTEHRGTDGSRELKHRREPLFEGGVSSVGSVKYTVVELKKEEKTTYSKTQNNEKPSFQDEPPRKTFNIFNGKLENVQVLIDELTKRKVKFNVSEIVFITRDSSGQIVWLEKGNQLAGLTHIIKRHVNEFRRACGVKSQEIPEFLKEVITKGKIQEVKSKMVNGHVEYAKKIDYGGKYYILTAIGDNGFIVSAYPQK
jgi:hypothetical protein